MTSLSSSEAPPKLLYVGDPVVATKNGNSLANIKSIKSGNKAVKFIDMNLLESDNLVFELLKLSVVEKEGKYFWTGKFEGCAFSLTGKDCIPIQPDVHLDMAAEDCTAYGFDKQLVLDIGVHLHQQPSDTMVNNNPGSSGRNTSSSSNLGALRPCYICQEKTTLENMRGHIALHIIIDSRHDLCGFCGREGNVCNTTLKQSSHRTGKAFYQVKSDCAYFHAYKRVPDEVTKTHKCTNKVLLCPVNNCTSVIWKYNAVHHFNVKHPNIELPSECMVSDIEKKTSKECINFNGMIDLHTRRAAKMLNHVNRR